METFLSQLNSSSKVWYLDWLYGGVNFSIDGNGGEECASYLSTRTRCIETFLFIVLGTIEVIWGWQSLTFEGHPPELENASEGQASSSAFRLSSDNSPVTLDCVVHSMKSVDAAKIKDPWPLMKRALLVLLCMVFGIEIGYKFATKSIIYILNPCHMLTFTQIYLLASDHRKKCKTLNTVFRVHLYLLNGALLAMVFYVVNTRFLPFEQAIYWIQHMLLYIIPIYLISLGGSYTPDCFQDMRWPVFSIGITALYHFGCLQGLAMVIGLTEFRIHLSVSMTRRRPDIPFPMFYVLYSVHTYMLTLTNLNNILCPAISDPFEGQHYRKWATAHQHLLIVLHGKLYVLLSRLMIRILSAVQLFCVAVTLKMWRWTIRLCLASARVYVRVCTGKNKDDKVMQAQSNGFTVNKSKML